MVLPASSSVDSHSERRVNGRTASRWRPHRCSAGQVIVEDFRGRQEAGDQTHASFKRPLVHWQQSADLGCGLLGGGFSLYRHGAVAGVKSKPHVVRPTRVAIQADMCTSHSRLQALVQLRGLSSQAGIHWDSAVPDHLSCSA